MRQIKRNIERRERHLKGNTEVVLKDPFQTKGEK